MLADGRPREDDRPSTFCGNALMVTNGDRKFSVPCMMDRAHPGDCAFESEDSGTAQGIYLAEEHQYVLWLSSSGMMAPGVTIHVHLTRE